MFFYKKWKKLKNFNKSWLLNTIINIFTSRQIINLIIFFVLSINKIRTIIVLMLTIKKIFRKKIITIISIIIIYQLTINNNRVKRNFLLFIISIIIFIKIVFISKINQIIIFNSKNRCRRLKTINYSKKNFRDNKNNNNIVQLILCF